MAAGVKIAKKQGGMLEETNIVYAFDVEDNSRILEGCLMSIGHEEHEIIEVQIKDTGHNDIEYDGVIISKEEGKELINCMKSMSENGEMTIYHLYGSVWEKGNVEKLNKKLKEQTVPLPVTYSEYCIVDPESSIIKVKPDGNCLFSSLSLGLNKKGKHKKYNYNVLFNSAILRHELVEYIRDNYSRSEVLVRMLIFTWFTDIESLKLEKHRDNISLFQVEIDSNNYGVVEWDEFIGVINDYCNHMKKHGIFGSYPIIQACREKYKVKIALFSLANGEIIFLEKEGDNYCDADICLYLDPETESAADPTKDELKKKFISLNLGNEGSFDLMYSKKSEEGKNKNMYKLLLAQFNSGKAGHYDYVELLSYPVEQIPQERETFNFEPNENSYDDYMEGLIYLYYENPDDIKILNKIMERIYIIKYNIENETIRNFSSHMVDDIFGKLDSLNGEAYEPIKEIILQLVTDFSIDKIKTIDLIIASYEAICNENIKAETTGGSLNRTKFGYLKYRSRYLELKNNSK